MEDISSLRSDGSWVDKRGQRKPNIKCRCIIDQDTGSGLVRLVISNSDSYVAKSGQPSEKVDTFQLSYLTGFSGVREGVQNTPKAQKRRATEAQLYALTAVALVTPRACVGIEVVRILSQQLSPIFAQVLLSMLALACQNSPLYVIPE